MQYACRSSLGVWNNREGRSACFRWGEADSQGIVRPGNDQLRQAREGINDRMGGLFNGEMMALLWTMSFGDWTGIQHRVLREPSLPSFDADGSKTHYIKPFSS